MTAGNGERACGTVFTVPARNPHRRFCSPRCRAAAWRTRHDSSNEAGDATNAVTPANGVPATNGVQRCPHCHHQLAVISVVVPTTATHVRTPEVTPMNPT